MNDRPFSELTQKEIRNKMRGYAVGDPRRNELGAELDLRRDAINARYMFWSVIAAAIAAFAAMITAIISLIVQLHLN